MALDPRLAPGGIGELRDTVAALHAAGISVILDVVFNHSGESDAQGTTLSLRGIDGASYFRMADGQLINDTGCGNTLACDRAPVQRLILDSLRHFVVHAGVDGFRFDLAPILGRGATGFDPKAALLGAIAADPVLADRVMIAEPWDVGPGGYQLGRFPGHWLEWNDRYRDDVRCFWRGDTNKIGDLVTRIAGSSDIFAGGETRSVNFVAAHDGFTLADCVAYAAKHNQANGEGNRDGHDVNWSWNNGHEGPTGDAAILAARNADVKALLATLFASRGTIMLTAGDEFGRSQHGNNNAYCLDDETSWVDWAAGDDAEAMLAFTRRVVHLRAASPALRQPEFFEGRTTPTGKPDLVWFRPDAEEMTEKDWFDDDRRTLGMWIDGSNSQSRTREGELMPDHSWLLLLHSGAEPIAVTLPGPEYGSVFKPMLDTTSADGSPVKTRPLKAGAGLTMQPRSLLLLRAPR
jgi:glycogen operon protein